MNVSLTPELEQFINDKVQTGLYQTASEVVREGLRLLKQHDQQELASLRRKVRAGFASIEREAYEEYDKASTKNLAEDVKSRGRIRHASSKKAQSR